MHICGKFQNVRERLKDRIDREFVCVYLFEKEREPNVRKEKKHEEKKSECVLKQ